MTEQDYAAKVRAAVEALPSHVDSSLVSRAAVLAILAAPAPSEPGLDDHRYCLADECWHDDAPAPSEPGLDAAWAEATEALAATQRLVMWQDRNGPRYLQVLAPDDEEEDMQPVFSVLADYPSKGLGKGAAVELRALAARLREDSRR